MLHPVYYIFKKTTHAEKKFSSCKFEVLALCMSLKLSQIVQLLSKQCIKLNITLRVARWVMAFSSVAREMFFRRLDFWDARGIIFIMFKKKKKSTASVKRTYCSISVMKSRKNCSIWRKRMNCFIKTIHQFTHPLSQ